MRLYDQDLTNTCGSLDTNHLVYSPFLNNTSALNCVPPGNYTLQVMGRDSIVPPNYYGTYSIYNSLYPLCLLSNLGSAIEVSINVRNIQSQNKFSLDIAGAFDSINVSGGILQPLQDGVTYTSQPDTFGCRNTVLPAGPVCFSEVTKAIVPAI